jgi:outer membrane murein-binding lipoprotein Lpp
MLKLILLTLLAVVSSSAMASDDIIERRLNGVETDIDIFRSQLGRLEQKVDDLSLSEPANFDTGHIQGEIKQMQQQIRQLQQQLQQMKQMQQAK